MSTTPILLPFRFFNFNKKNQFLKIVQQKGFEVVTENQTIINSITTGSHQGGSIDNNSYTVKTKTENVVAYDIGIKKILDDEDKKYINLLAEYFNLKFNRPNFFIVIILGYLLGFLFLLLVSYIFPHLQDGIIARGSMFIFCISGPTLYFFIRKRSLEVERITNQTYQTKLKPYLQGINF